MRQQALRTGPRVAVRNAPHRIAGRSAAACVLYREAPRFRMGLAQNDRRAARSMSGIVSPALSHSYEKFG
jgi:hypothetical protein